MPIKPEPKKYKLQERKRQDSWSSTNFKYSSLRWMKLRDLYRLKNPLCVECMKKGTLEPVNIVDHIIPISQGGDAWDWDNLQSLCEHHHNKKTAKERKRK